MTLADDLATLAASVTTAQADYRVVLAYLAPSLDGRSGSMNTPEWNAPDQGGSATAQVFNIAPGSLNLTPFASTIRPVAIITAGSLPTLPDAAYPNGCAVTWPTIYGGDGKLYRNDAGTWKKNTGGADIDAGSITANQIAADTITAAQIAVGAIGASEIAANAVTANAIAAGVITADKLAIGNAGQVHLNNPDFETGDFTGWNVVPGTGGSIYIEPANANSWYYQGIYRACLNRGGAGEPVIYQRVRGLGPGDYVHVSFLAGVTGPAASCDCPGITWLDAGDNGLSSSTATSWIPTASSPARISQIFGPAPATTSSAWLGFGNTVSGQVLLLDDIQVTRQTDIINADGNVVIDPSGIAVTNGKITVTNAGSTVIIDGTSDMFKITATGTVSVAVTADGTRCATAVSLSALGALAATPAHQCYVGVGGGANHLSYSANGYFGPGISYCGNTLNGGNVRSFLAGLTHVSFYCDLDGSSYARVTIEGWIAGTYENTFAGRYNILQEAAV